MRPALVAHTALALVKLPARFFHSQEAQKLGEQFTDRDRTGILRVARNFGVVKRDQFTNTHNVEKSRVTTALKSRKEDAKLMEEKRVGFTGGREQLFRPAAPSRCRSIRTFLQHRGDVVTEIRWRDKWRVMHQEVGERSRMFFLETFHHVRRIRVEDPVFPKGFASFRDETLRGVILSLSNGLVVHVERFGMLRGSTWEAPMGNMSL